MPDFLNLGCWNGIPAIFHDWLEELDPGIHQFSPVTVFYKDGCRAEKTYYAFNPRRYLSGTVIAERSTPKLSAGGRPMNPQDLLDWPEYLEFDELAIGGRHLWIDTDFHSGTWFLSDELGRRVLKAKLRKLDMHHHRLGRR